MSSKRSEANRIACYSSPPLPMDVAVHEQVQALALRGVVVHYQGEAQHLVVHTQATEGVLG